MSCSFDLLAFRRRLLSWFDKDARDLPWRRSRDPYAIWVSEIMLQQTRVAAVLEHYARFMQRFTRLESLAAATEDDVLAHWSGLGYYRRARLLHKAARFVATQFGGNLPSTAAELRVLPGVGEYTAAAIASIGFGEPVACIDGNVERVLSRVNGWGEGSGTAGRIRAEAARLLDPKHPGDFNQAMMELGALVCLPRAPRCSECPIREQCRTQGEHIVAERKKMRSRELAYVLMRRMKPTGNSAHSKAEVLLVQRPNDVSLMPGLWELPELKHWHSTEGSQVLNLRHSITDTNYYVTVYQLQPVEHKKPGRPKAGEKWFAVDELHTLPLTGLARKALKRLRAWPGYDAHGPVVRLDEVRAGHPLPD
ncbi:MAG TPA: A/G-specific adenine glycosylase [Acidobacteriaceae bacterium]|nr:A/G-specific adenine glycosylase [Acidobacteriaceae bacterium]